MADRDGWPDLSEYPLARDAAETLALDYDSIGIERRPPMGALQWTVTVYKRDMSSPTTPLRLFKTMVLHVDGRLRQESA